ncbi:MAG: DNA polymerase III subunit gamma and tau [candidate division WS6 bacterium OLB20]|uniref:DNA polymerase III subunit gamma and tau n=1 Tax=candidate division WS6 bacterium OLB20 TaxID=1617426 RepID=A0A136LYC8_9BACT|nr:MAG: DNA polymerase III subunit gamma and tau [candidate division WS6 bacterium OLB20]
MVEAGRGSFRDAETILEKVLSSYGYVKDRIINREDVENVLGYASSEIVGELYRALLARERSAAVAAIAKAEESGVNMQQLITQLLESARSHMASIVSGEADADSLGAVTAIIRHLMQAAGDMRSALIPVLPLEVAAVMITTDDAGLAVNIPAGKASTNSYQKVSPAAKKSAAKKPVSHEVEEEDEEEEHTEELSDSADTASKAPVSEDPAALSMESLRSGWDQILHGCKKINPHMVAMLTKARLDGLEEGNLLLSVPYKFHKSRLEQKRSQDIFASVTHELFGVKILMRCTLDEAIQTTRAPESTAASSNSDIVEEVFSDMI